MKLEQKKNEKKLSFRSRIGRNSSAIVIEEKWGLSRSKNEKEWGLSRSKMRRNWA